MKAFSQCNILSSASRDFALWWVIQQKRVHTLTPVQRLVIATCHWSQLAEVVNGQKTFISGGMHAESKLQIEDLVTSKITLLQPLEQICWVNMFEDSEWPNGSRPRTTSLQVFALASLVPVGQPSWVLWIILKYFELEKVDGHATVKEGFLSWWFTGTLRGCRQRVSRPKAPAVSSWPSSWELGKRKVNAFECFGMILII